ncbi:MAG TPA: polysialyltransferase family glycosyltransferase [Chitinophagaceae bacterium]
MRILLIVQPWRVDYYSYLKQAKNIEWVLLWYEKPGQTEPLPPDPPLLFKEIIYWQDYSNPQKLLKEVKPDRVLFYEIIDLRQIALIVSAGAMNIPTYYSDHGAAADKEASFKFLQTQTFRNYTLPYLLKRLSNNFLDSVRSKMFYYSVFKGFKSLRSYLTFFFLPFKMLSNRSHTVLLKNRFKERIPKVPIIFNQPNFEDFETYTGVTKNDVYISGVPFFDKYHQYIPTTDDYIVYIDHPYYEEGIANWTKDHHQYITEKLFEFAENKKVRLFIKLHPRSNKKLWDVLNHNKEYVQLLQTGDFTELYLGAKLILSYSSTLVNGFLCAKKNVVLLGWNPEPHIEGADFTLTGLCHASLSIKDLITQYEYWLAHNLAIDNEEKYLRFLEKYNYPFDGKAAERIINLLHDPFVR